MAYAVDYLIQCMLARQPYEMFAENQLSDFLCYIPVFSFPCHFKAAQALQIVPYAFTQLQPYSFHSLL